MKKSILAVFLLGLMVSSSFGFESRLLPIGSGARANAMGGAGSALVDDISSAFLNPAGIGHASRSELKIAAGTAQDGSTELLNTLNSMSNPSKFMADNYLKALDIDGDMSGIIGFSASKVGISVIPIGHLELTKAANTVNGSVSGLVDYEGILTLGDLFSFSPMPMTSINLGANIKSVNRISASTTPAGNVSTDEVSNYNGLGFDLGLRASFDNWIAPVSVAFVVKDLSENLKGKHKVTTTTYNPLTGAITGQTTAPETNLPDQARPTTTVIGAAAKIPGAGLRIAVDYDSVAGSTANSPYNLTHIGAEYPVMELLDLRVGSVSGAADTINQTTYGIGFNKGINLNAAWTIDNKNSKNNATYVDIGFSF